MGISAWSWTRWGKIAASEATVQDVDTSKNSSEVEYELLRP